MMWNETSSGELTMLVLDTGTTLLIVEQQVAEYYYSSVPNSGYSYDYGGWLYPCSQQNDMPSFSVG